MLSGQVYRRYPADPLWHTAMPIMWQNTRLAAVHLFAYKPQFDVTVQYVRNLTMGLRQARGNEPCVYDRAPFDTAIEAFLWAIRKCDEILNYFEVRNVSDCPARKQARRAIHSPDGCRH